MRIESLQDLLAQFPDVDGFWDFDDLAKTELRIRQDLPPESEKYSPQALEILSQWARLQGLKGEINEGKATIAKALKSLPADDKKAGTHAEIRLNLEMGRLQCLARTPAQAHACFTHAWDLATASGETFLAIDAAVMFSITQPPKYRNEWLQKAIQMAETSESEIDKRWLSVLYVMDGWHAFDFRQFDKSLVSFNKALEQPQFSQDATRIMGIKWCVARALRALNRIDEALNLQKELLVELNNAGKSNGYVHLEIAECLQLKKNYEEAKTYFETAYKELSTISWFSDNKPSELSRIQHLSKKK